jgi:hypothetical protein
VSEIRAAQLVLFYLFDVAETIDLRRVQPLIARPTEQARLLPKQPTPPYLQYENPPLTFDGEAVGIVEIEGFHVRARLYDYGVVSIAFRRGFSGEWPDLLSLGQTLVENDELEDHAERICRLIVERLHGALGHPRDKYLSEDYLVIAVNELAAPVTADDLMAGRSRDIARMLRGERGALSDQETAEVLKHRLSYLADDMVIPTWSAAFIYDSPAGTQAALEILEFANSQLLQFRYYDERLDRELARIFSRLQRARWLDDWMGKRYARATREVHRLFVEVTELTDRSENTLKFVGDIYAARLFRLVADRLGLSTWKSDVEAKLRTVNDIYDVASDQAAQSRGQFLELTIVVILILELVLILLGVMQ